MHTDSVGMNKTKGGRKQRNAPQKPRPTALHRRDLRAPRSFEHFLVPGSAVNRTRRNNWLRWRNEAGRTYKPLLLSPATLCFCTCDDA